jgi:Transposase DNA-binding
MSVRDDVMVDNEGHWSKQAIDVRSFKDARLGRRCTELLRQLGAHMGGSIPFVSQDWANTKAAYRFFSNPNVEEGMIQAHPNAAETAPEYDAIENKNKSCLQQSATIGTQSLALAACLADLRYIAWTNFSKYRHGQ